MDSPEEVSLLWPPGPVPSAADQQPRLTGEQAADLELDTLVDALVLDPSDRRSVSDILMNLCPDPRVIAYRQGVLESILGEPTVAAGLEALLPKIDKLRQHHVPHEKGELLHEVAWRLGELAIYLDCVKQMSGVLDSAPAERLSEGLRMAGDFLSAQLHSEPVLRLVEELPRLLSEVRGTRSLTIGVNVDEDLQPSSATLLSINARSFDGHSPSLLHRLFGAGAGAWNGIAPLHRVPPGAANPMLVPLFRDLSEALNRSLRPVATALERFVGVRTLFLDKWGREIAFYLGAARLSGRLRRVGLSLCRPEVSVSGADGCRVAGCYNVVLALKLAGRGRQSELSQRVVTNDLALARGEIAILTGPNQGGKTTYMRSVGLVQVMCQAGLLVPGVNARVSVVDAICTHFPRGERGDLDSGRFAEEMRRLRDIFARATPASLILLNESLGATSPRESLELAREVVRALQVLGARAIFTTHLYELASGAGAFNPDFAGPGRVTSLVARQDLSHRIEPGPPAGTSQAREIAARCGVGYNQLVDLLRSRGITSP